MLRLLQQQRCLGSLEAAEHPRAEDKRRRQRQRQREKEEREWADRESTRWGWRLWRRRGGWTGAWRGSF
eukprot:3721085-Rhodomonas_salina.1